MSLMFQIVLLVATSTLLSACGRKHVELSEAQVGLPEKFYSYATETFRFNPLGIYGEKIQYDSLHLDKNNGVYSAHCRKGECFGLEVTYRNPIPREKAVAQLEQLIPTGKSGASEIDDLELKNNNHKYAEEYFYYPDNYSAELHYKEGSTSLVNKISAWHGKPY